MQRDDIAEAASHHKDRKTYSNHSNMPPVKKYPLNRQRRGNSSNSTNDESRIVPKAMQRFFHKLINEKAANAESEANSNHSGSSSTASSDLICHSAEHPLAGNKAELERWSEHFSVHEFKRTIGFEQLSLRERYEGALSTVVELNPPGFVLPQNSIIICIKTETEQNFIWSVRHSKWGNNRKVNDRIQQVWDEKHEQDKIYFLFSVNGSSQYCGLAEMVGSVQRDAELDGWEQNHEGAPTEGATPIMFVYVKNVRFHHFKHIEQPRNGHSIANMWCGMHFPEPIARQVVQTYVETPHCENYLVDILRPEDNAASSEPQDGHVFTDSLRGGRESFHKGRGSARGGRGGFRQSQSVRTDTALATHSWRRQKEDSTSEQHGASDTSSDRSAAQKNALSGAVGRKRATDNGSKAGDYEADIEASAITRQSNKGIILATYDENGNLRPYKPDDQARGNLLSDTGFPQLDGHSPLSDSLSYSKTSPGRMEPSGGVALSSDVIDTPNQDIQQWGPRQSIHDSLRGTRWGQLQNPSQAPLGNALNPLSRSDWTYGPLSSDDVFSTPSRSSFEQPPQSAPPQAVKMILPTPQRKSSSISPGEPFKSPVDGIYPLPADATPQSSTKSTNTEMPPNTSKLADLFSGTKLERGTIIQTSSGATERGAVGDGKTTPAKTTITPQRSHRARDSEFSRSFDARVKSDLSNIVESPDYSSYSRRGRVFTPESSPDTSAEDMSRCLKDFMFPGVEADAESPRSRFGSAPSSPNYTFVSQ